jgi:hypothetical protein
MLVLLIGGIYVVRFLDDLSCHDVYTKFHGDRFRRSKLLGVIHVQIQNLTVVSYICVREG